VKNSNVLSTHFLRGTEIFVIQPRVQLVLYSPSRKVSREEDVNLLTACRLNCGCALYRLLISAASWAEVRVKKAELCVIHPYPTLISSINRLRAADMQYINIWVKIYWSIQTFLIKISDREMSLSNFKMRKVLVISSYSLQPEISPTTLSATLYYSHLPSLQAILLKQLQFFARPFRQDHSGLPDWNMPAVHRMNLPLKQCVLYSIY
jgi:hypothetical protein